MKSRTLSRIRYSSKELGLQANPRKNLNHKIQSIPKLAFAFVLLFFTFFCTAQNIELKTQSEVDAFDPTITVINGDLLIGKEFKAGTSQTPSDITNLDNLSNIQEIEGNLTVSITSIDSFNGLKSLTSVNDLSIERNSLLVEVNSFIALTAANNISIAHNEVLGSINGFNELNTVIGFLKLAHNENLSVIEGFNSLATVQGDFVLQNLDALSNLEWTNSINTIGKLILWRNNALVDLNGFNSLYHVELEIAIFDNDNLLNLDGFSSLTSTNGNIGIVLNKKMNNIDGLGKIKSAQFVAIQNMNSLTNLNGLQSMDSIAVILDIEFNDLLTDLKGLESLSYIGLDLNIKSNDNLLSLEGLNNLKTIRKDINITNNDALLSLDGLYNNISEVDRINVKSNESLFDCCVLVDLIYQAQSDFSPLIDISNNANYCNSIDEILEQPCLDNYISGVVYHDTNLDKIQNEDEFGIPGIKIIIDDDDNYVLSNSTGKYFVAAEDSSVYNLVLGNNEGFDLTTDSSEYNVFFESGNVQNDQYDFGLLSTMPYSSKISLTAQSTRCNTTSDFIIHVRNDGYEYLNGDLVVSFDPEMTYQNSIPQMEENQNSLIYRLDSLAPLKSIDIKITFDMPSEQFTGDYFSLNSEVFIKDDQQNNISLDHFDYQFLLLCSYDPNDKLVSPVGVYDENYTLLDEELKYTIRFQNTGNAPAIDIIILDTIDQNLDMETFQLNNSSFPVQTTIRDHYVEFYFKDIWLVDSLSNEPESHGFINYRIKVNEDIEDATLIENTAFIYFDFNPPIKTNTTRNTMVEEIPTSTTSIISDLGVSIAPNPNNGIFNLIGGKLTHWELYNSQGMCVLKSDNREIDIRHLSSGLYLIKVFNEENSQLLRIVKSY